MEEDIIKTIIAKMKAKYSIENSMDLTCRCLAECTKDGKHLDFTKLDSWISSSSKEDQLKFAKDISGIVNSIDHSTHSLVGYEPMCGYVG